MHLGLMPKPSKPGAHSLPRSRLETGPSFLVHFNQLSLVGIAAHLLVVPLAGAATTLGMLALLVELASGAAAALLFNALWILLLALRASVWAAAAVPAAMIHLPAPGWPAATRRRKPSRDWNRPGLASTAPTATAP
jgi:hypothetical protein